MKSLIKRLRELEAKATKGPWICCAGSGGCECTGIHSDAHEGVICDFLTPYMLDCDHDKVIINNMKFVEETRNALPALLDYIEQLEAEVKEQKKHNLYQANLAMPANCRGW